MLEYFAGDERPAWQATITVNGVAEDYSSGYTFEVKVISVSTVVLTKTTNITGGAAGVVTVAWAAGELAITPGPYTAQLRVIRSSDTLDFTITEAMLIKARS